MIVKKEYCDLCGHEFKDMDPLNQSVRSWLHVWKCQRVQLAFFNHRTERSQDYTICEDCEMKLIKWIAANKKVWEEE